MYSEKVMEHFRNPRNVGVLLDANGIGEIGNPTDGDLVKIYIKVDNNHIIQKISFQTFGCAAAIASSSMLTELAKNKHIEQAKNITKEEVAHALDGLPARKMECSNIGADALKLAIEDFKKHEK